MEILNYIPALIRVAAAFAGILLAIRNKISLGNSFISGSILLCVFFAMEPVLIVRSVISTTVNPKTISLSVIVTLILILSNCMEKTGQMRRMLSEFQGLLANPRLNLIIFPSLIGLLPMPGGAVFSAPMVKSLSHSYSLPGSRLSFINYWFRHIWEYWWPLYPGVLLTTVMADVNLLTFVCFMIPMTAVSVLLGLTKLVYWKIGSKHHPITTFKSLLPFLKELIPILIVIVLGLGGGLIFSSWFPKITSAKEIGLIIALVAAVVWTIQTNKMDFLQVKGLFTDSQLHKMIYMIFSILIFKGVLEDSNAVESITRELLILKIPIFMIAVLLPFMVGMITGITVAFVGSTFPMIIPLIHSFGQTQLMIPYMMLALTSGFAGVLLSPLHLCLILSNEYFQTSMKQVYRHLWLPCCVIILISLLYFSFLIHTVF